MPLKRIYLASLIALTSFSYSAHADTLLQVYQAAKTKDPTILSSKAQYDLYSEMVSETNAALLPQITFSADTSYNELNNDYSNSNYGATLALSQSLYDSSAWQALDIAEKQATQYAVDYDYAAQDLLLRTATAYFDVLRADEALRSVLANKRAVERQLKQTKKRFDVGLLAITDVHEVQAEYDGTVTDVLSAENDLLNSYYTLSELTGEEVRNIAHLNIETFSPQKLEGDIQSWQKQALEHNLELHSERIAKELAKMQIESAQAGHKPTLGLTAALDHDSTDYREFDATDNGDNLNTATIGIELSVPLYSGGQITSQVKQAQYNYVIASEALTKTFRSIATEIKSGYNNVRTSISSISAYQQSVISSKSALDAIEAGFNVGTRTTLDVLDATQSLYDSEKDLADARYDYIINMLTLKSSAGTLTEQDLIDISASLVEE